MPDSLVNLGMRQSWEGWGTIVSYIWGTVSSVHGGLSYLFGGMFC